MAAALLRARLADHCDTATGVAAPQRAPEVVSAGVDAAVGAPMDPVARRLLESRGVSCGDHRASALSEAEVQWAELILVMEETQRRWLLAQEPAAAGKTYLLGHWGVGEIPDPHLRPMPAYADAWRRIEAAVEAWLPRLCLRDDGLGREPPEA